MRRFVRLPRETSVKHGGALVSYLDRTFYPDFSANWDDQLFREFVLAHIDPTMAVLDLGAGAGVVQQMNFRGIAAHVCGVDPDPRVASNPYLDEGRVGRGESIPYEDASFDLVFAANVLEHLVDPDAVFTEVRRVLKPGGRFLFKTPNRTHYMPLVARSTPLWFHKIANRWRGRPSGDDFFPTTYRANRRQDLARIAETSGMSMEDLRYVEGRPEYLRMSFPTYLVGLVYERLVNQWNLLARFRIVLIGSMRRPEEPARMAAPEGRSVR